MISGMTIKNFKCFDNFKIADFAPITILGGKNNIGKSSVLEAVLVQNVFIQPNYFAFLMNLHNELFTKDIKPYKVWDQLFFNTFESDSFEISYERPFLTITNQNKKDTVSDSLFNIKSYSELNNNKKITFDKCTIEFKKIYDNFGIFQNELAGSLLNQEYGSDPLKNRSYSTLHIDLISKTQKKSGKCQIHPNGIMFTPDNIEDNSLFSEASLPQLWPFENIVIFKNVFSNSQNIAEWLSKINLNEDKKKILISTLQLIEPKITSVSTVIDQGVSSVYVSMKGEDGLDKLIPANYMGDGFNKIFQLLLTVMSLPNGILVIDEFENGLHYELYEEVLLNLFKIALSVNCQIIMTTHNRDLVESSLISMKKLGCEDLLCYQRIEINNGKHNSIVYHGDDLEFPFNANLEIR